MNSTLKLRIILPSRIIANLDARMVIVPGKDGIFGVLPGHVKLISNINVGIVQAHIDNQIKKFFAYGGIAEVSPERLNIITEFAILLDEINKSNIINKINELESELLGKEKNSVEADIVNNEIKIHRSLLEFVIN